MATEVLQGPRIPESEAPSQVSPPDSWECCVCLEDGATTAKMVLACKHNVCLSCYTGIVNAAPTYAKNSIKCPVCRRGIRNSTEPPSDVIDELNLRLRTCLQHNARMIQLERDLEMFKAAQDREMERVKELATSWSMWETTKAAYEKAGLRTP